MFGRKRKIKPLVGIDIGSSAVKLIELSRLPVNGTAGFRVEHFAIEPLPSGTLIERKIIDVDRVAQSIRKAVSRSGTSAKQAVVAVAGSAVITKMITMPDGLTEVEIEDQVRLEADQCIPYPLEEVNMDFQVVGPTKGNPAMVDVLLVASRQENVDDRIAVLEVAGLTPALVDVEAFAMENACALIPAEDTESRPLSSSTLAVADVGSATTTLHVMHEGRIVYSREQNFGGQQLLDEVQRRYGLTPELAMRKISDEDVAQGYDADVLAPFQEGLSQQIGRALQFFYSGTTFNQVDRILLAGRPAGIPGINRLVCERLELPTQILNPFRRMSISPVVSTGQLLRNAPGMMVAVGLALRGFD
jgi:type IV pilus assembly protein PilM